MQPDEFLKLIQQPNTITRQDLTALENLVAQYPYFQLAFALIAKAVHTTNPGQAQKAIQQAAIYATNRQQLKLLLENRLNVGPNSKPDTLQLEKVTTKFSEPDVTNSYLHTIYHKQAQAITKHKSLEQLNLIENFIQKIENFSPIYAQNPGLATSQLDLSQESTTLHDDLITESLAQVMVKQGKFQRAIEIYNKLKLKFPEKKSYFSVLSEQLEKEMTA
jgi:tetratricopeptide (TPR) repeat protein